MKLLDKKEEITYTLELTKTELASLVVGYGCSSLSSRRELAQKLGLDIVKDSIERSDFYNFLLGLLGKELN